MNLHEYQGKELLKQFGVKVQEGIVAETVEQAVEAWKVISARTGSEGVVVKAQVHAGGRGKGGGVKFAPNLDALKEKAFIGEDAYYKGPSDTKEFYMSVLLDRKKECNVIMYSTEGGMDIEEVAEHTPEKIYKEWIDSAVGIQAFQARRIAFNLGLSGQAFKEMVDFVQRLYNAYVGSDSSMFEINPVLKTSDDKIIAVDAKVNLDDNALYRHKDLEAQRDLLEEDPTEVEAAAADLNYVKLDGNVGCMVNGAGLAMATMDIIKLSGGEPANFLDVGGTANAERVEKAFRIIMKDPHVKAILINIFGGIVRCDRVAEGVIEAYKNIGTINIPIIVRLQGTNADIAKKMIDEAGLKVQSAILLSEAADLVAKAVA